MNEDRRRLLNVLSYYEYRRFVLTMFYVEDGVSHEVNTIIRDLNNELRNIIESLFSGNLLNPWLDMTKNERTADKKGKGSDPEEIERLREGAASIPMRFEFKSYRIQKLIEDGTITAEQVQRGTRGRTRGRGRSSSSRSKSKERKQPAKTARTQQREKQSAARFVEQPYHRQSSSVAFFPWLNSSRLDLSYAQIFSTGHNETKVEHCLISCLRYYGISEFNLRRIAIALCGKTFHIPRKDLVKVCELCHVNLQLSYYNNSTEMKKKQSLITAKPAVTSDPLLLMGCFKDHIFPNINTDYSMFYLRNLRKIQTLLDDGKLTPAKALKITRFQQGTPVFGNPKTLDTISVVRELFIGDWFRESSDIQRIIAADSPLLDEEGISQEQKEFEIKEHPQEEDEEDEKETTTATHGSTYFAADFESFTNGVHEVCLAAAMQLPEKSSVLDMSPQTINSISTFSQDPVEEMFTFIINKIRKSENIRRCKYKKKVVFFHNLRYDRTLFEKNKHVFIRSIITKDNNLYSMTITFKGILLEIRDSLKMIPVGIAAFSKTFQLPPHVAKKADLILYDFYTKHNMNNMYRCTIHNYAEDHTFADGDPERKAFQDHLEAELPKIPEVKYDPNTETFYPKALYEHYLRHDVAVLMFGLAIFRKEFNELTQNELDVFDSLTISSYAFRHMSHYGAFDESYQVSGNLRAFLSEAVYGGRVYCNPEYEGTSVTGEELDYFDACSLYPSAIRYICKWRGGFPTGPAEKIPEHLLDYIALTALASEFTVRIRITKIVKKQFSIPFIAWRHEGKLHYIQEIPDDIHEIQVVVDKQTLEDYLQFHEIQFDILEGVYWQGTSNQEWGSIVENLYKERLQAKAEGKAVKADCIKLILNSAYGKTITRTSTTTVSYLPKERKGKPVNWELSIANAFHTIQKFREVGNQVEVTKYSLDKSYNLAKYGSMILAASKHIMNEVFDLMSSLQMPIYYTDTDSFVMRKNDRALLAVAFKAKYQRELIGKQLGNFHSDFSFKTREGVEVNSDLVHSIEFIPAGRKLYLHHLMAEVDGKQLHALQFKAKGCTLDGLWYAAAEFGEGDLGMIQLYRSLTEGKKVKIILNPPGKKVKFVYSRDNTVTTPDVLFIREICSAAARNRLGYENPRDSQLGGDEFCEELLEDEPVDLVFEHIQIDKSI